MKIIPDKFDFASPYPLSPPKKKKKEKRFHKCSLYAIAK